MKILCLGIALLLVSAASAYAADAPVLKADFQEFGVLPYGMYFGEVAGAAVNSRGHVFVFSRGNTSGQLLNAIAAQLLELDGTGKFVREIGHNLYGFGFAHTVRVDRHDNIWTVDKGMDMVVKFSPEGGC
jgi:opacity protein-like surface antigen